MVTGRRPFAGDSNLSVLAKILNDDPAPPSTFTAAVSSDVERAILRCLRKDPARRYQSMADLKVALDDLATDSAAAKRCCSRHRCEALDPGGGRGPRFSLLALAVAYFGLAVAATS